MSKEFLTVQNEYERKLKDIDVQINEFEEKFRVNKSKYSSILKEHKEILNSIERDIKHNKQKFNNQIQDQRVYYLEILRMGIDVR